jgi:hypothetical protein
LFLTFFYCDGILGVTATEENPSPAVEESASLPQGESVAPGAEAMPPEAIVVEGK